MMLIKPQKERYLQAFLLALGVSAIFFGVQILSSYGLFLYYGDFNVQQIPFYQLAHKAVKSGNLFWNWHTDLGVDFIGSYSFYLIGSPFFWLTLPFPNAWVPYLMGPLLMLKFACASLTAYCYLRRFVRYTHNALMGALMYAFSGYAVYNIFFNHFHEAIIYFPLLLLSMELFVTENKRGVFAITVFLCALSNYYFFFGMAIFCIIYFAVKVISKSWRISWARFGFLALEAVLGTLMAMAILLPTYFTVIGNDRATSFIAGWDAVTYPRPQINLNIIQSFFFPPDNPARPVFFPDADIKWSSISGWLPLVSLTGVIGWLQTCKCTWQKRLFTVCCFMAFIPVLNSAFSMFNYGYYARWFYMPVLICALISVQALERTDINWASAFRWSIGITLSFAVVIGLMPSWFSHEQGFHLFGLFSNANEESTATKSTYRLLFWGMSAIAIVSLLIFLILIVMRQGFKKHNEKMCEGEYISLVKANRPIFWRMCVVAICCITVLYATCHIEWGVRNGDNTYYMSHTLINGNLDLDINDGERIDVYEGTDNTAMFLGYPSIQAFHSNVPGSVFDFYEFVGVDRGVATRPESEDYEIRGLLAVRYLIDYIGNADDVNFDSSGYNKMPGFTYLETQNDFKIYQNDCFVPYGFTYDYCITEETVNSFFSSSKAQILLKAMLLTKEQVKKHSDLLVEVKGMDTDDAFMSFGTDSYIADCKKLQQNVVSEPLKIDNFGFTSKVNMKRENLVFYAVPYERGWSVTIDGKAAEVECVNAGLMAVRVGKGEHTLRFDYNTPGLVVGIAVSIASAIALAIYFVLFNRAKKANPDKFKVENVERNTLLNEWARQDAAETAYTEAEPAEYDFDMTKRGVEWIKGLFAKKPKPTEDIPEE
ncbi:MAG: YfhO family protein [Clostridia bacterium]|nr:YfhO family protein [Clostridia bacterium]